MGSMVSGLRARLGDLFIDREFFMRSNGAVSFIKVSAKLQRRVALAVTVLIVGLLAITVAMAVNQLNVARERAMMAERMSSVAGEEKEIATYRRSVEKTADELEARQDMLDSLWKTHFGNEGDAADPEASTETAREQAGGKPEKTSSLLENMDRLDDIRTRQFAFVDRLTAMAETRSQTARESIRGYGLNPDLMARQTKLATGGPLIRMARGKAAALRDPKLSLLVEQLGEMALLEQSLSAIPSAMPAQAMRLSSGFGYRSDPFSGESALHAGLDFTGAHGSPILAAADGEVVYAGVKGGYGNCIEIRHAGGMMTRYGHLSRIAVKPGDKVERGTRIGGMGSTGRSTGTHLHFEVRMNGQALNPAKFFRRGDNVHKG